MLVFIDESLTQILPVPYADSLVLLKAGDLESVLVLITWTGQVCHYIKSSFYGRAFGLLVAFLLSQFNQRSVRNYFKSGGL